MENTRLYPSSIYFITPYRPGLSRIGRSIGSTHRLRYGFSVAQRIDIEFYLLCTSQVLLISRPAARDKQTTPHQTEIKEDATLGGNDKVKSGQCTLGVRCALRVCVSCIVVAALSTRCQCVVWTVGLSIFPSPSPSSYLSAPSKV